MRDPNSVRGRREAERAARLANLSPIDVGKAPQLVHSEGVALVCPEGLPESVAAIWRSLVDDLIAAKVPIKSVDSHAIVMAARCMDTVRQAEQMSGNSKLEAKLRLDAMRLGNQAGRDLQKWLEMICATPASRARIGVKGDPEKKMGPLAQILAAKQAMKA